MLNFFQKSILICLVILETMNLPGYAMMDKDEMARAIAKGTTQGILEAKRIQDYRQAESESDDRERWRRHQEEERVESERKKQLEDNRKIVKIYKKNLQKQYDNIRTEEKKGLNFKDWKRAYQKEQEEKKQKEMLEKERARTQKYMGNEQAALLSAYTQQAQTRQEQQRKAEQCCDPEPCCDFLRNLYCCCYVLWCFPCWLERRRG